MRRPRRSPIACAAATLAVAAALVASPPLASAATPAPDLNADGWPDLVVGVPAEDSGSEADAGIINVLYGSATWPGVSDQVQLTQSRAGGTTEPQDRFGGSLAIADFNGDGRADVAASADGEDVGTIVDAGAVNVVEGSTAGLGNGATWQITQSQAGGTTEAGDRFGGSLAAGDFNGDGLADLAVGAPTEALGPTDSTATAGVVNVLYGSATGLTAAAARQFTQSQAGGTAENEDRFGAALTAGDFNGDGVSDLAVGAPGEDLGDLRDTGVVNVLFGSPTGLTSGGARQWTQSEAGGWAEGVGVNGQVVGEQFGEVLAAADFNDDGRDDLAVGVPQEVDAGGYGVGPEQGVVNLLYGSAAGLDSANAQQWTQWNTRGSVNTGDRFGAALAVGNFDRDAISDLAIGADGEDLDYAPLGGVVDVLHDPSSAGTLYSRWQFDQNLSGGEASAGERFGSALAGADFDRDGVDDLAIGAPGETLTDGVLKPEAGVVNVKLGPFSWATKFTRAAQRDQRDGGGTREEYDHFGAVLAAAG